MRAEVVRRYQVLVETEEFSNYPDWKKHKEPKPNNWKSPQLLDWLVNNPLSGNDYHYVVGCVIMFFDNLSEKLEELEQAKKDERNCLSVVTLAKLRLYHIFFLDRFRDDLLSVYDSLSRMQLDARNSGRKYKTYFEKVAELFNDESYSPMSYAFKDFHYGLAENIVLSLPPQKDDCQLTAEKAKISFRDAKSNLNVAINDWKKSGNGKGNKNEDIEIRINNCDYDKQLIFGEGVKWVDDDRFDFCKRNVPFGYFWCVAELNDLVKTVSQNCESLGIDLENIRELFFYICLYNLFQVIY